MNLKGLFRDKRVIWGGVAVAGAAGAFTLWKRRGSTPSSGDAVSPAANAGGTVAGAFPDTTGTNIATWAGQYSEALARQLAEYQAEVRDALSALEGVPTSGGTGTAPALPRRSTLPSGSGSLPTRSTSTLPRTPPATGGVAGPLPWQGFLTRR